MQGFRDALDFCGFMDLGFTGLEFTWHSRRHGHLVWERLDSGVANYDWLSKFPAATVRHLHCYSSDHRPISISLNPNNEAQRWSRRPFRFEEMWLANSGCSDTMLRAWQADQQGTPMFKVTKKLKKCKKMLKSWSKEHFGSFKSQIAKKKELLWKAGELAAKGGEYEPVVTLRRDLNVLLDKESRMWRQRARTQSLAKGDKNTKYFHAVATQRKRKKFIKGIQDDEGVWQSEEEVVSSIFVDFYTRLFTSSNVHDIDRVLEGVNKVVFDSMNTDLLMPYSKEEVDVAIKQMAPLKAPSLDGMPPIFYQSFWQNVGPEVSNTILSCLNSETLLKSINHTFITLIPKVCNTESVTEFRPISLCNVLYKIISKVIANRLKPILNSIIVEAQSAFIADRLITDNILIAFESLHYMNSQCSGREGFMAMKLDMSKAYDRVEWCFLEKILLHMGL